MKTTAIVLCITLLAAACTQSTRNTYDPDDVGRTTETTRGSIVSSRVVDVRGETSNAGALGGGVIGGAGTGFATGSGWLALIGAAIGAGAGYLTERTINSREGIEYLVELDDGRTIMVVQNREGDEAPLADGAPVLVQVGGKYTRVLPDPRGKDAPRTGEWVDPDSLDPLNSDLPPPPPPYSPQSIDQSRLDDDRPARDGSRFPTTLQ